MDSNGNLYGTAQGGGANYGTVFSLTKTTTQTKRGVTVTWTPTVLWNFGGSDGMNPIYTSLIRDGAGNLYGTTLYGGSTFTGPTRSARGDGTVFELSPPTLSNPSWSESVLYSFHGGTADGSNPVGLAAGTDGNFYGATNTGGANGFGTLFKLAPNSGQCADPQLWCETVIYSFAGGTADGSGPIANLTSDTSGNFYGSTYSGGAKGLGMVFEYSTAAGYNSLYDFDVSHGSGPYASPIIGTTSATSGYLFGTTTAGGTNGGGTAYKLTTGGAETVLHSFK